MRDKYRWMRRDGNTPPVVVIKGVKAACRAAALVLTCVSVARGGEMSVGWAPVVVASGQPALAGYQVAWGGDSGDYNNVIDVGAAVTATTLTGLPDCTSVYVAVKARNVNGTLSVAYSNELVGWARPRLNVFQAVTAQPGTTVTLNITGMNFAPGVAGMLRNSQGGASGSTMGVTLSQVTCSGLVATITVPLNQAAGVYSLAIYNTDRSFAERDALTVGAVVVAPPTVTNLELRGTLPR